jgi:hypothetical protein
VDDAARYAQPPRLRRCAERGHEGLLRQRRQPLRLAPGRVTLVGPPEGELRAGRGLELRLAEGRHRGCSLLFFLDGLAGRRPCDAVPAERQARPKAVTASNTAASIMARPTCTVPTDTAQPCMSDSQRARTCACTSASRPSPAPSARSLAMLSRASLAAFSKAWRSCAAANSWRSRPMAAQAVAVARVGGAAPEPRSSRVSAHPGHVGVMVGGRVKGTLRC